MQYMQGEKKVVTDILSRLDMEEKPSTTEALIMEEMCSDWYCYFTEKKDCGSHSLTFQQLGIAQKADKELKKFLQKENLPYN